MDASEDWLAQLDTETRSRACYELSDKLCTCNAELISAT